MGVFRKENATAPLLRKLRQQGKCSLPLQPMSLMTNRSLAFLCLPRQPRNTSVPTRPPKNHQHNAGLIALPARNPAVIFYLTVWEMRKIHRGMPARPESPAKVVAQMQWREWVNY